jgi:hypothetical protein
MVTPQLKGLLETASAPGCLLLTQSGYFSPYYSSWLGIGVLFNCEGQGNLLFTRC